MPRRKQEQPQRLSSARKWPPFFLPSSSAAPFPPSPPFRVTEVRLTKAPPGLVPLLGLSSGSHVGDEQPGALLIFFFPLSLCVCEREQCVSLCVCVSVYVLFLPPSPLSSLPELFSPSFFPPLSCVIVHLCLVCVCVNRFLFEG